MELECVPEYVQPYIMCHCVMGLERMCIVYCGTVDCHPIDLWLILIFLFQDQKEQVKQTSQRLTSIFAFLERTLLRGRAEKREKKKVQERESSNIQEAREGREVAVEAVQ